MSDVFHTKQDSLREGLRQLVRDLHKNRGWHYEKHVLGEKKLRADVKELKDSRIEKEVIDVELDEALNILLSFSCSTDTHQVMTMARKAIALWDGEIDIYNRAIAEARLAYSIALAESNRTLKLLRRAEAGYSSDE